MRSEGYCSCPVRVCVFVVFCHHAHLDPKIYGAPNRTKFNTVLHAINKRNFNAFGERVQGSCLVNAFGERVQ